MKKTNPIYQVTAGNPKKLKKPVIWTVVTNINLFSFMFLALFVITIYSFFAGDAGSLDIKTLWLSWGGILATSVVVYILERKATHATFHDGYATSADGRIRLAEHIRKLPLGFLMSKDSGELGNTMMNDFSQIEEGVTHILPQLISGIIVAFLALFGMAFADWRMALAMFAGLPVTFLILWGVRVIDRKRGAAHTKARIEQTNRLQEYLTGMKVIKAYNLRGANFKKLERAFYNFMKESIKLEGVSGPFYLIAVAFLQIGLSMITMAGTYLLLGGTLELPMFIIFLLVGSRVFDPLVSAITQLPVFTYQAAAGKRIVDLLEEPTMQGDGEAPKDHDVIFENVTFGYGEDVVLHNVNASFPKGTMTAIVGLLFTA